MFLRDDAWQHDDIRSPLAEGEVCQVDGGTASLQCTGKGAFQLRFKSGACLEAELKDCMPLEFYPFKREQKPLLFRFSVNILSFPQLNSLYSEAYIYLVSFQNVKTILDGFSKTVTDLNKELIEELPSPKTVDARGWIQDQKAAIAYLGFFCAFTPGKEAPRLILDDRKDLAALGLPSASQDPASAQEPRQDADWSPRHVVLRDVTELDLDFDRIAKETLPDHRPYTVTRFETSFLIRCHLVDGTNRYRAAFRVDACGRVRTIDCSEPTLIDDKRRVLLAETPIFANERQRRRISVEEMETWIRTGRAPDSIVEPDTGGDRLSDKSGYDDGASPSAVIWQDGPLLVTGSLDLRGKKIEPLLSFADLYVDGDLILEHAFADRSLIFKRIEIRGRLLAQHLDCAGTVSLQDGKVLGWLTSPGGRPLREPVIDFHNSNIKEDLDLSGMTLHGGLDCQQTDIGGLVDLSGLQTKTDDRVFRTGETGLAMRSKRPASAKVRSQPLSTRIAGSLAETVTLPFGAVGVSLAGSKVERGVMLRTPPRRPSGLLGRSAVDRETQIVGWLSLKGADIGGDVDGTAHLPSGVDGLKIEPCRLCIPLSALLANGQSEDQLRDEIRDCLSRDKEGAASPDVDEDATRKVVEEAPLELLVDLQDGTRHLLVDVSAFADFSTMTAKGDVRLQHLWASGVIDFSSADVRGQIDLRYATIGCTSPPEVEEIGGRDEVYDIVIMPNLKVKGEVNFGTSSINGTVFAIFCEINGILNFGSRENKVTRIAGKLVFSGSKLNSDLSMEGTKVFGQIEIITGTYGRIQAAPCIIKKESTYHICNHENRGFIAQDADIQGINLTGCRILKKNSKESESYTDNFVSGSVIIENCNIKGDLGLFRKFSLEKIWHEIRTLIKDKETKTTKTKTEDHDIHHWNLIVEEMRSFVENDIKILFCQIGSTIDIRDLKVGKTPKSGNILIRRCTIGANLNASAIHDLLSPPNETPKAEDAPPIRRHLKLEAHNVSLPFTTCEGTIDLSGLAVTGDVDASRAATGGDLIFWRGEIPGPEPGKPKSDGADSGNLEPDLSKSEKPASDKPAADRSAFDKKIATTNFTANIKGKLSLLGVRASRLFISGDSFDNPKQDLSLEQADVGYLVQIAPIPANTDYSDLTVKRWDLCPTHEHRTCSLQRALENSQPFNRAIYSNVERMLRDRGEDAAADAIYRHMRERAIRRGRFASVNIVIEALKQLLIAPVQLAAYLLLLLVSAIQRSDRRDEHFEDPLRWLGTAILQIIDIYFVGRMTGYGTRTFTLLLVFLPMLALSAVVFSKAENFAPTASHLGEHEVEYGRDDMPRPEVWGAAEAAATIARYHIPIIPLFVESRWEPADDRPLCLATDPVEPTSRNPAKPLPDGVASQPCRTSVSWISPAGYALIVFLLHWIIWPLAIAGFSGLIRSGGRR